MKIFYYTLLFIFCATLQTTHAQNFFPFGRDLKLEPTTLDSTLMKKIVKEACPCFEKMPEWNLNVRLTDTTMKEEAEKVGNCVFGVMKKFKEDLGLKLVPDSLFMITKRPPLEIFENIDPQILMYAMRDCHYLFHGINKVIVKVTEERRKSLQTMRAYQDSVALAEKNDTIYKEEAKPEEAYKEEEERTYGVSMGKIKKLKNEAGFTFLVIENEEGKDEEFLWIERFHNDKILLGNFKKQKGKKISIETLRKQFYHTKKKDYIFYKQISSLELIE